MPQLYRLLDTSNTTAILAGVDRRSAGVRGAFTVAQKVSGVGMTSSPGFNPAARIERCSAAVQECVATAWDAP